MINNYSSKIYNNMKTIGILLFNNVEILDFAGPFEVFTTAQRLYATKIGDPTDKLFETVTIAEKRRNITTRGGLKVNVEYGMEYHPHIDILIVPGGVVDAELGKDRVIDWIRTTSERADITASICTGVFLLAATGVLEGMDVTTHWEDRKKLKKSFPDLNVREGVRWTDNGHILSSAGVSAGIDMSLYLVSRLVGREHAEKTAHQMEYSWQPV